MNKQEFKRYEFKYILDPIQKLKVRDFFESISLNPDPNSPKPYTVTSLYFDSPFLGDYYEKAGGLLVRKKLRARIYGRNLSDNVADINLEIKNKHDMFIIKKRTRISVDSWRKFIEGDSSEIPEEFQYYLMGEGRLPTVIVRYTREAFEEQFSSRVRVTLDYDIETIVGEDLTLEDGRDIIPVSGPFTVLEVKFGGPLPWWFGVMLRKFNLRRTAYSKYSHGMDTLYKYMPLSR